MSSQPATTAPPAPASSIPRNRQELHSGYPNQRLGIDFVGPFPQSRRGNRYLLVLVDFFTKWAEAIPLLNQEAVTVAQAATIGCASLVAPDAIHSDQGSNFESHLIRALCAAMG